MILYSIVPAEIVFQGYFGQDEVKYFEAGYKGERVIVAQSSDKQYSIARLLSTNPHLFLKPEFQPGSLVEVNELQT